LRSRYEEREKHQPSLRQSGAGQLSSPSASVTLLKSIATELRPDSLHSGISRHETASKLGGEPGVEHRRPKPNNAWSRSRLADLFRAQTQNLIRVTTVSKNFKQPAYANRIRLSILPVKGRIS